MGCFAAFAPAAAIAIIRPPLICASRKKGSGALRAKPNDDNDPFLQSAINRASLRFQETQRPEPLLLDPYAGSFVTPDIQMDIKQYPLISASLHPYCLATKFIDDKLLSTMNHMDGGPRQVVLLTDGMDTRPYRLNWPNSTIIFDISLERVFKRAAQNLEGVGAKIPRSCLFLHVSLESSGIQEILIRKGFSGNRPSIWAFQGLPVTTLESFEEILFIVSSLAMKECLFLGELPAWLAETEIGIKSSAQRWMDKIFMRNGFRVDVIDYDEVARNVGKDPPSEDCGNILFVAEQLRFSDDQIESWRTVFQRVEEEGDEEGFEEL